MTNTIQVITTTETKADAQAIARALVEKRLAACVQIIGPITCTYWWQGEIETAKEWMRLIKSRQDLYEALEEAIGDVDFSPHIILKIELLPQEFVSFGKYPKNTRPHTDRAVER